MAFYHKKFLLPEKTDPDKKPENDNDKEYESGCKTCDDCPVLCAKYYPPSPSSKHHMSTAMILSLCIIGAAFLFLSCFVILRYRSRRRNSRRLDNDIFRQDIIDELQGPVIDHPIWYIRTVGLPQSVIDSIEVFKFKTGEGLIEKSDCSVCLSEFQEDESLRLLPKCSHAFHVECIDMWLRSHKNCPVCRAPVINSNNGDEIDSGETSSSDSGLMEENNQVESDVGGEETGEMMRGDETTSVSTVEDEKMDEVLLKGNGGNGRFRVLSDLADHRVKVDQELEAVRRSVSLDFSSASTIYVAVANVAKKDEGCCDSALFQGPVSVKKSSSFSCLKKHSRS